MTTGKSLPGSLKAVDRGLSGIEAGLNAIGGIIMVLLAAAVLADVVARYYLNYSIPGLYELMQLGLVVIVYFGIAYAQQKGDHVRIELLNRDQYPRVQKVLRIIGDCAGVAFCMLVTWKAGQNALVAWQTGDTMSGLIPWPTWPAVAAVPLGFLLLGLRLLLDIFRTVAEGSE